MDRRLWQELARTSQERLRSGAKVTYGLNVVANLFGDQFGDVLDEGVLDADLVAVYVGAWLADDFERLDCD